MNKNYKIKTVKEYLKEGPPQFDIILRREVGRVVHVHVANSEPKEDEQIKDINIVLNPPESGLGIIRIVKRISDDVVFHQSDMVECNAVGGSCVVIEFNENRIHCVVAGLFDQETTIVEINDLTQHELVDEEREDGKDIWADN